LTFVSCVGVVIFYSKGLFVPLLLCRMGFWLGLYLLIAVQMVVVYKLFSGPELTVAVGFMIFGCRTGGTFGFLSSGYLLEFMEDDVGMALWFSVILVGLAWLSTVLFAYLRSGTHMARTIIPLLEAPAPSSHGTNESVKSDKSLSSEVKGFTKMTWVLVIQIGVLYATIFPFETVETEFLIEEWGVRFRHVGWITAMGTIFGLISWSWGLCITNRGGLLRWSVIAWVALTLSFVMLMTRAKDNQKIAVASICLFGVAYSYLSTTCWTLIPDTFYRCEDCSTGAVSLTYVFLSIGMFLSNFVVGILHDLSGGYAASLVYFLVCSLFGLYLSVELEKGLLAAYPSGACSSGGGGSGERSGGSNEESEMSEFEVAISSEYSRDRPDNLGTPLVDAFDKPVPLPSKPAAAGRPVVADSPAARGTGVTGARPTLGTAVSDEHYFGGDGYQEPRLGAH